MKIHDIVARTWGMIPIPLRNIYYCISDSHSLASLLLPDQFEVVKVKKGIAEGMMLQVNLRYERGYYFGNYEWSLQSVLTKVVRPGMTAYNIGANIGFYTLALVRMVGFTGQVVAFEPNPKVRERLLENLSLNSINDRVRVEDCALSDSDGLGHFSLSLSDTQGRFDDLPYVKPGSNIQVSCKRLDTYVAEVGPTPDFILMDVEHAEGRVLRGMFQIMEDYKPVIVIEMHGPASIKEAWNELKEHNYYLASVPDLLVVNCLDKITYGHYLAAHSSYFTQN